MAHQQRCRGGRHRYEAIPGAGAGIERKRCNTCGSVVLDLTGAGEGSEPSAALFTPRRPTLFSVRAEMEKEESEVAVGFGRHRGRR